MAKFRSKTNYAQVYNSDKQGYNLGLDGAIYLRQEVTPRVFNAPRIGTQGSSVGAAGADTDISAHATPAQLKINLRGAGVLSVSLATAGLTTGVLIAAALETAINTALSTAGRDDRVWVAFDGGDDHYTVYDQSTGTASTVVITAGDTNDISLELLLGVANGGTEAAGTNDQDFLLYTTGGPSFSQPVESNQHRSGRFHSGVIRQKKVAEFDWDTYVNMSGSAGASIDTAVALLIEATLGKKTVSGSFIDFEQDLPIIYFSIVRVSTIFAEYFTGGYTRQMNLGFPGEGPATIKYQGKAADCSEAGIAKLASVSTATATHTLVAGESKRFTAGCYVMAVDTDGRTILAGADGTLKINSYDDNNDQVVTNSAITVPMGGYIVPWDPGAVQQTARDNIYTDLVGSFKLNSGSAAVDVTDVQLTINNDHVDLDNRFGSDTNKGYVAGNRMTAELSVTFDLSNETYGDIVRTREFAGFTPVIVLGNEASGRYLKITANKWIPAVPTKDVPESGTTSMTLTGNLFQSSPGAKDPIKLRFG
jgi:hypothetical protein